MTFSTILIATLAVYFIYYAANIIYDLFIAGTAPTSQSSEEEIIITDFDNNIPTTSFSPVTETETSFLEEEIANADKLDKEGKTEDLLPIESVEVIQEEFPEIIVATPIGERTDEEETDLSTPAMNGGIEIDDLFQQVCASSTPDDLAYLSQNWNNHPQ